MIKAKGEDGHGNLVLLFGLSEENLCRLRQGEAIRINLAQMGLSGHALIFYGTTEEAMVADLEQAGVLCEDLITHPTRDEQA